MVKNLVESLTLLSDKERINKGIRHFVDALYHRKSRHDIECIHFIRKKLKLLFYFK